MKSSADELTINFSNRYHKPVKKNPWRNLVGVIALLGVVSFGHFLFAPNIMIGPGESPLQLAMSRAEAANMAMVSLIQSRGREVAVQEWSEAMSEQDRYTLVSPYLAFAPESFDDFMPSGYRIEFPGSLNSVYPISKALLFDPDGMPIAY